jgi:hypothetical protein
MWMKLAAMPFWYKKKNWRLYEIQNNLPSPIAKHKKKATSARAMLERVPKPEGNQWLNYLCFENWTVVGAKAIL